MFVFLYILSIDNVVRILNDLNAEGIDTSQGGVAVMDLDNPIIECLVETEHPGKALTNLLSLSFQTLIF